MMSDDKQAEMASDITPERDADSPSADNSAEVIEEVREEAAIITQLQEELSAAQAKADEYLDKLQRSAADFQNSRRRLEKQLDEEVERANGALIHRLLPVIDDFDLAFQNVPSELQEAEDGGAPGNNGNVAQTAWVQGFRQIRKKLLDLLGDQGLTLIDTSGEFDPNLHEAISSEPSDSVSSGHIIEVMRAGYLYKGRVLRPALVRVAM
ncbi:MAG: nucleotide exchange factor GrpE [Caldilineaceae bacterium]|nr:nucleotide exchange factor GrpE [Caldilineaceae bacterium]